MNKNIPAVSVIIPMYNAEKYIGECLDSILAQTFTDYEVIIVDDCSTDNSCAVVESYLPKFNKRGGGASLIKSRKNSGGCAVPRNIGMDYSHGKYLTFVDSDDFIAETTLKEMYSVAQSFDADVVACEKYFELTEKNTRLTTYINRNFVEKPTLITDDLSERVADMAKKNFIFSMCMKLIRKEFLLAENLKCLNIIGEDALLTWCMLCTAKKYVLIPNVTYFYRLDSGSSISRNLFEVEKLFHKWFHSIIEGFKYLDEFLNEKEFFKKHLDLKYALLDTLVKEFNQYLLPVYAQIPAWQLETILRRELNEIKDNTALTAFLFSQMNIFNLQLNQAINLLIQQPKEAKDFQRQQIIIQQQAAQIQQLQHQLKNAYNVFR